MEQLNKFLELLRQNDINIKTNWTTKTAFGILQHCTLYIGKKFIIVMFQIYEDENGYDYFVKSENGLFTEDLIDIQKKLK